MERLRSLTNLHHLWSILRIGRVCYAKYFEISLTLLRDPTVFLFTLIYGLASNRINAQLADKRKLKGEATAQFYEIELYLRITANVIDTMESD